MSAVNALVNAHPGQSPSYYCRLSPAQSGLPGSQERKERALRALIQAGRVVEVPLLRPVGRKTHELYPAEKKAV